MKPTLLAIAGIALSSIAVATARPTADAPTVYATKPADRLMKVGDRMVIVRDGRAVPMTAETTLSNGSRVTIDGTVIAKNGGRVKLPDCAVIGADGKRIRETTTRVLMIDGQLMVMRDGITRRVETTVALGGGRWVNQEGYLTERNGSPREIPEGTLLVIGGDKPAGSLGEVKRNLGMPR
ncbi:MAG: hypothetical protein QM755_03845 [Luteolibacter sp.]